MSATWGNAENIYSPGVLPPLTLSGHRMSRRCSAMRCTLICGSTAVYSAECSRAAARLPVRASAAANIALARSGDELHERAHQRGRHHRADLGLLAQEIWLCADAG